MPLLAHFSKVSLIFFCELISEQVPVRIKFTTHPACLDLKENILGNFLEIFRIKIRFRMTDHVNAIFH